MKFLNRLVFVGLILSGSLLLIGVLLGNGSLMGLGTYFGWFFAAFSMIAYLIVGILQAVHHRETSRMDLYPVNFGLAIVGVSVFGFTGQENIFVLIAVFLLSVAIAFMARRLVADRFIPLAILVLLFIPFLSWAMPFWMYLYLILGVILISISTFERLIAKKNAEP